jgi:hypothetical protein
VDRRGQKRCQPSRITHSGQASGYWPLPLPQEWKPKDKWIRGLDQTVANEIDRAYWTKEKRNWPGDLMGGQRHSAKKPLMKVERNLREAILGTERVLIDEDGSKPEALKGDDIQLEYDADGYPKLPARLDRRPKPSISEAA